MKFEEKDLEIQSLSEQLVEKDKIIIELQQFIESKPPPLEDILIKELKELVPKVLRNKINLN